MEMERRVRVREERATECDWDLMKTERPTAKEERTLD